MAGKLVSAEVTPREGKAEQAARRLDRLGFRVLHTGVTISVEGAPSLWQAVFGVSFQIIRKERMPGVKGTEVEYQEPTAEEVVIPEALEELVEGVEFARPPELF